MLEPKSEILQGTLDLMVLKTLDALGPLHGYGIDRRIEQISEHVLRLKRRHSLCLLAAAPAEEVYIGNLGYLRE